MKKLITLMNTEEMIGSIAHLLRTQYIVLLKKIEDEIEDKTLDKIVSDYYDKFGIEEVHKLNPNEKSFLQIYDSENYYIFTSDEKYCKDI